MMQLRDYQLDIAEAGLAILREHGIVYLSMQPRTGKTCTSLHIAKQYGAKNVLFLSRKIALPGINKDYKAMQLPYTATITNYEQLNNLEEEYDLFIIDEAHSLGQYPKPSERTKKLKEIIGSKPCILLSGTPSPESYSQLYHQFWISDNSPWAVHKNFYSWAKHYVNVHQRQYTHGLVNDYSRANIDLISTETSHLFLSYTQEEAGFTSLIEEEVVTVKMQPSTYAFANALKLKRIVANKDGDIVMADTEVKLMQKLHQIYSGTVIIDEPDRTSSIFDYSKARYIYQNYRDKKVVVFYKFIAEEMMLRATIPNIVPTQDEFNLSPGPCVFIAQIQAGREGANLSTADVLIMLNIDFSAVSYFQARARIQTKDRAKASKVLWLFSEGGIEEKIYKTVHAKKDFTLRHFRKEYGIADTKQNHPEAA